MASVPQIIQISGRKGFNEDLNGIFEIGTDTHEGKVYYINRENKWVLRWQSEMGLWIVDWRGTLETDTISAAFVRENVEHPALITKHWKVYQGETFETDPEVRVDTLESSEPDADTALFKEWGSALSSETSTGLSGCMTKEDEDEEFPENISKKNVAGMNASDNDSVRSQRHSWGMERKKNILSQSARQRLMKTYAGSFDPDSLPLSTSTESWGGLSKTMSRNYCTNLNSSTNETQNRNIHTQPPTSPDTFIEEAEPNLDESEKSSEFGEGGDWLDEHGFIGGGPIENTVDHDLCWKRARKWREMLYGRRGTLDGHPSERQKMEDRARRWDKRLIHNKKLKSRIRKGIPGEFRNEVWVHVTGARRTRLANPGIYESYCKDTTITKYEKQIRLDIARAYRRHSVYNQLNSPAQKSLYRLLNAYAKHHEHVGYNQAASFVAALLLLYMEEVDAFWTLNVLTTSPKYSMSGLWSSGMPLIHVRFHQMERIVKKYCPRLATKFEEAEISPAMYQATQWFTTIFLASDMPFGTIVRIWDIYLHEGPKIIFKIGLVLMMDLQKQLKQPNGNEEEFLWESIRTITKNVSESVIDRAVKIRLRGRDLESFQKGYSRNRSFTM